MQRFPLALAIPLLLAATGTLAASPGPTYGGPPPPPAAPKDTPWPGEIQLAVDASDTERRIVHVHEQLTGISGETVLLYPKWLPGTHAPEGAIDRFAGLRVSANGQRLAWSRDPLDVFAFRVPAAAGAKALDIEFDYLSPTSESVGPMEIGHDLLMLEWNSVVLYPAGHYVRQIPVTASLTVPGGWQSASALEVQATQGAQTRYRQTSLETLVDSPVYAGRYANRVDLDPGSATPVHLNLFAGQPQQLAMKPEQLKAYRELVQQAYRLYGSHHYSHYDFLYSLSDQIQQNGLEHHQSSENGTGPESLTEWDKSAWERDLLPHEFTHSWNGKFRRPADLWVPSYQVPMQDSLLWVYEGQTEYWGKVLAARSGLRTAQQALDDLAATAAFYDTQAGRRWRNVQDTTNDEIINPRRPMAWPDWQRFEDYYSEGALIWLEADTLIRERSQGKRSLDDFARRFFGINDGSYTTVTYTFDDIVKALEALEPYDWRGFLRERLDGVGRPAPLAGLKRGGYRLAYTDKPSDLAESADGQRKRVSLGYSLGVVVDAKDGTLLYVAWNSPAFKAGLAEDVKLVAVNGEAWSGDALKDAIKAAQGSKQPIELIVKAGERYRVVSIDYHDGLRYPHLVREEGTPALLDAILAPRS
jgi:predicted metalloprotease with PDZ domain